MQERLKLETAKSIAASTAANTKNFDLTQCRRLTVLIVPNAAHTFSAKLNWAIDICSGAGKVQESIIASASQGNVISAVIDAKADIACVEITNGDAGGAHTYAVYVHRLD